MAFAHVRYTVGMLLPPPLVVLLRLASQQHQRLTRDTTGVVASWVATGARRDECCTSTTRLLTMLPVPTPWWNGDTLARASWQVVATVLAA